jgi:hypothetical protein
MSPLYTRKKNTPGVFFDSECGGDMFLWNVDSFSKDYTEIYSRRWSFS